ncbi:hypothetical protein D3C81_930380 [compost metagenome]
MDAEPVAHALLPTALHMLRPSTAQTIAPAPEAEIKTTGTWAQSQGRRLIRHGEGSLGTIGLPERHVQIIAETVGIQVADFERPGLHGRLMYHHPALAYGQQCRAVGNTVDGWRKTALRSRQHAFVTTKAQAQVGDAVEHFATAVGLTQGQLRPPRRNIALHVSGHGLIALLNAFPGLQIAFVAPVPGAGVDTTAQPQK